MFDDLLMLIDGDTDGSLTTTGTYDGLDVQESPARGYTFYAVVPAAAGTTPTADITIEQADTDANASYASVISFPQITAAGRYSVQASISKRYIRAQVDITGTTPDFGAVSVGISPGQWRHWNA